MKEETKAKWQRRKYLIPNLVTVGNLFCGFIAIIYASSDRFEKAAIAIGIAILLDGLDGRVARGLKATSKFGVEFDSFSDLISFGFAPAFLLYHWALQARADEFGVIVCFLYALGAAGRLARFNISQESVGNFEGMPTPAAAGFVAALVNLTPRVEPSPFLIGGASLLMLVLGYLMVSSMEFYSLKKLRVSDTTNRVKVLFGVSIALVWYDPAIGFMLLALGYALSGPVGQLRVWARGSEPSVVDSDTKEGPSRISEFPKL